MPRRYQKIQELLPEIKGMLDTIRLAMKKC